MLAVSPHVISAVGCLIATKAMHQSRKRMESQLSSMVTGYELVHTISDYYDGPRSGIADFQDKAHFYQCVFDENVPMTGQINFNLAPLRQQYFNLP